MKEAADILNLTPRTIAFHKYAIMEHLGIKTSAELVQYAVKHRLVTPRSIVARRYESARPTCQN